MRRQGERDAKETLPKRKSPRLRGYDYRQIGVYFVTICTHNREHHFGQVVNSEMRLSPIGEIASLAWNAIPDHFTHVELDMFVVMPNHMHGIVIITSDGEGSGSFVGTTYMSSLQPQYASSRPNGAPSGSLGVIVSTYKAAVTREVNRKSLVLDTRLWQERYHDHIVRNQADFDRIREYVLYNPARWEQDIFYSGSS